MLGRYFRGKVAQSDWIHHTHGWSWQKNHTLNFLNVIHRRWKLPDVLIDLKHARSLRLWLQCPHTPVRTLTAVYRLAVISTFRADRSAGCCRTLCSDCDRTDEVQLSNVTWLVCSSWMNLKKHCTLSHCGKILVSHLISLRCSAMMFCGSRRH